MQYPNMKAKTVYLPNELAEILEAKASKNKRSFNATAVAILARAVKYNPDRPAA